MKNLLKYTAFALLFLICCISLCFFPVVQKFIAKRVLSHYFDDVAISDLAVGLYGAKIEQFSVRYDDTTLRFNEMRVSWSLRDLFVLKMLNIKNVTISDASISLESEVRDPIYYEKKADHAALEQATLGAYADIAKNKLNNLLTCFKHPISIDLLVVNGTFDVYEKTLGEFSMSLSDFAPLHTANLQFALTSSFSRKFDGTFSLKGGIVLHRALDGAIDSISADSTIISQNCANNTQKEFNLSFGTSEEGDKIFLNFTDNSTARKIFDLSTSKSLKSGVVDIDVNAYLDNTIFEYFLFGNRMNAWSMTLVGKGENVSNEDTWVFKSNLDLDLSNAALAKIAPGLTSSLGLHITSSLNFRDKFVELSSFTASVEDSAKKQLRCSCELQNPYKLSYDLGFLRETWTKALKDICLDINVDQVDLGMFGTVCPDVSIAGTGCGKFRFQVQNDGALFSTNEDKLRLQDISLGYCSQPIIRECDFETRLSCRVNEDIDLELSEFSVANNNLKSVALQGGCKTALKSVALQGGCKTALKRDRSNISGYFVGDLPTILAQPLFRNDHHVTAGVSSLNFDIEVKPDKMYTGDLGLKLKSVSFAGEKKSLEGECSAKVSQVGDIKGLKFDASGSMHYFGDTSLELHGVFTKNPDDGLKNIQASLHGTKLCISDLLALKDVFELKQIGKKNYGFASNKDTLNNKSSKRSILDELSISFTLGIDEAYWKTFCCLSNMSCDVKCETKGIYIPNFKCYVFEAPLNGSWNVIRETGEYKDVYSMNIAFLLSNLNASKCVRALGYDPSSFTGQFNLEGNLESEQSTLSDALSGLHGSIRLNGHSGMIRFSSFLSSAQKSMLGIAGIASVAMGGKSDAISKLMDYFDNFPYDTVSASAVRGSDNNIVLDNFVVKNADMKFLSRGKIFYSPNVDMKNYGLFIDSQIFSKGELTDSLGEFGLISGDADYYGYSAGPHVAIHGTVGDPDLTDLKNLFKKIGNAVMTDEKSFLNPKNLIQLFGK